MASIFFALALVLGSSATANSAECELSLSRFIGAGTPGDPVIKLREDNGNTTLDFTLNASNVLVSDDVNAYTVAAWLTSTSATNAYCHTWYDQSGTGNNAVQTTNANQPRYVASAINSHPALLFDGTNDFLDFASDWLSLNSCTVLVGTQFTSADRQSSLLGAGASNHIKLGQSNTGSGAYFGRMGSTTYESTEIPTTTLSHVMSVRHGSNTASARYEFGRLGGGTNTATGAAQDLTIGADTNGGSNFFNNYIQEVQIWTSSVVDATLDPEIKNMAGVAGCRVVHATDIAALVSSGDSLYDLDLDGDGDIDYVVGTETGRTYWFEQGPAGTFTSRTIRGTTTGTKIEGCIAYDPVGDGTKRVLVFDQNQGDVRIYDPAAGPDYEGTWTEGVIFTAMPNVQRAWREDIGGSTETIVTWEGDTGSNGGWSFIRYDGSGSVTDAANWTQHDQGVDPGGWAICSPLKDMNADGRKDVVLTKRSASGGRNASADPGIAWFEQPASNPVTGTAWTEHDIDTTNADFLNICWGDLFGNAVQTDILANIMASTSGLRLYNSASGFGSTITPTTINLPEGGNLTYNVVNLDYQRNSRDAFMSITDSRMTSRFWDGSTWRIETFQGQSVIGKADNYIAKRDVDGDGQTDLVMSDSVGNTLSWVNYSVPPDPSIVEAGGGVPNIFRNWLNHSSLAPRDNPVVHAQSTIRQLQPAPCFFLAP